ncbi:hypothetical protein [Rufibacter immobilis]|uniref:hypothetical protein n=1 Tax=Rufibacter immobilis TaxID=1348778 RepID=UPI0035E7FF7A
MTKQNRLKAGRQSRIKMYQAIIKPDPIVESEGFLWVEGHEIPFKELINIHAGSLHYSNGMDCRWFYRHGTTGKIYSLSARYDLKGHLWDVQTESIQGADLIPETEKYSEIMNQSLSKQTDEGKVSHAERVMGNLKDLLALYNYDTKDIDYEIELRHGLNGCIIISFLHTGVLVNPNAAILIKLIIARSFAAYRQSSEDRYVMRYEIYSDSLEDVISTCPTINFMPMPLLHNVEHYLAREFSSDFSEEKVQPDVQFLVEEDYLELVFVNPDGQTPFHNRCYYLLTEEDRDMANYLLFLNYFRGAVINSNYFMSRIIKYDGFEKFGYSLAEKTKDEREKWMEIPANKTLRRQYRIQNLLADLD